LGLVDPTTNAKIAATAKSFPTESM